MYLMHSFMFLFFACHIMKVTHGAIQFTAYEELRKAMIFVKSTQTRTDNRGGEDSLNSFDFAALGAGSKVAAILLTYPYQEIFCLYLFSHQLHKYIPPSY
uniref:Uncharacterized protein n=1 Tax=Arundo donax TaxID=35708 RepID=A0A0A9D0Y8_ARUDO